MNWWPFDDNEELQTAMLKHLAWQQDILTSKMEEIMAEFTNLNNSLAKMATDLDAKLTEITDLRNANASLQAENDALKAADSTDQANVDAAQAAVDAMDARLTA